MFHLKPTAGVKMIEGLNVSQSKMIGYMEENPRVKKIDMAYKMDMTIDGLKYNLKKLKASGIVKRVNDEQGGYWEIDYSKIKKSS